MIMLVADAEIGCHAQWVTFLLKFTLIKQLWVTGSTRTGPCCLHRRTLNALTNLLLILFLMLF